MKADRKRLPGFYWVRFEGEVIVAEYTDGDGCIEESGGKQTTVKPHWHVPGSDVCFKDREICELLSDRLEHQRAHERGCGSSTPAVESADIKAS